MSHTRRSVLARTGAAVAVAGPAGGCLDALRDPARDKVVVDGRSQSMGYVMVSQGTAENVADDGAIQLDLELQFFVGSEQEATNVLELGTLAAGERTGFRARTDGAFVPEVTQVKLEVDASWA